MQELILYIVLGLLCLVVYLLLNNKRNNNTEKNKEEIDRLKESLTTSFGQISK